MNKENNIKICFHCGQPVRGGISMPNVVTGEYINLCNKCVEDITYCYQLSGLGIEDRQENKKENNRTKKKKEIRRQLTPSVILEEIDKSIISQTDAKKTIVLGVYQHYKRLENPELNLIKNNILISGPTGTGKTEIARIISKMIDVPFVIVNATSLTEAGYVGDDVETILTRLLQKADWDIEKAQKGIIYIDEIDKICRKSKNVSITRDVSGEGVQQALLKIIEGSVVDVPVSDRRKSPNSETVQIDTSQILFIAAGAFEGIENIKIDTEKNPFGFQSVDEVVETKEITTIQPYIEFGMIPEFMGRFPIIAKTKELTEEDLYEIIYKPEDSILNSYKNLFRLEGVNLEVSEEFLREIAKKAKKMNIGARGLRGLFEEEFRDILFDIPGKPIDKIVFNKRGDYSVIKQKNKKIS